MALPAEELAKAQGLYQPLRLTEGITRGELADILQQSAKDAHALMQKNLLHGTFSSGVRAQQLEAATRGLGSLSASMWGQVGALTRKGVYGAASMAADHQIDRDYLQGMPFKAIRQYSDSMFFSAYQSAEDIISRRTHGFKLADRIYRNGQATVMQVGSIVEKGLAQQLSARELAARVRQHFDPAVPGGSSYAAMRLARTEINNAHHDTTIRLTEKQPWVLGYQWHLSSSHPKPDTCDELASGGPEGDGVYPKGDAPSKPHPHCLCFLEIQQMDRKEFNKKLVNGGFDDHLRGMGVTCGG